MGAPSRGDPARVGREAGRRPREEAVLRAALVDQARRRHGTRAGHAVRRAAGRRPARQLRHGRPGARARAVHPARAGPGRVGRAGVGAPEVLRAQPAPARGGRRARAPLATPRHRRLRGHPLRLLRRPGRARGRLRGALRAVVEARAPEAPAAARLRPVDAHPRHRRGGHRVRLPPGVAGGGADLQPGLPLRAGRRRRRPDHRGAGRDPQPGRRRRLLLERPRAARGAGHRADPLAAEEPARLVRPRPRQGAGVPADRAGRRGAAARRARALVQGDHRRRGAARGVGLVEGARAPAPDLPRRRRAGPRAGPWQGPRGAQAAVARAVPAGDGRGRDRLRARADRRDHLGLRRPAGLDHPDPRRPRGHRLPRARRRGVERRPGGRRLGRGARRPAPSRCAAVGAARP